MVALTHNAVRRQLFDVFTIANALGKLNLDVTEADLARVYGWLGTLDHFVSAVFKVEQTFLYPIIDANVRKAKSSDGSPVVLPHMISIEGRHSASTHVMDLLSIARKTRDVATGETSAKIHALRYALDQFGANILDYFATMELFVPKLLKKALRNGPKDKMKLEKKLFQFLLAEPHGAMLAALLMQCIESKSRRNDFLTRNIKKAKDRDAFRTHVKRVETTHMQLATTFDSVASRYERTFTVNTFLQHYNANADGKATLQMLGDLDINAESDPTATAAHFVADSPHTSDTFEESEQGSGLNDDVLEVLTPVRNAP